MSETTSNGVIFDEIPAVLDVPGTYVEIQENQVANGLYDWPVRVLIMAQKLAAGAAVNLKLYTAYQPSDGTYLGGDGSMLEAMVKAHFATGVNVPVDVIAVADPAGSTKAVGNFAITGAWTVGGEIDFYIGGQRVPVDFQATDTAIIIAANAVAAINAVEGMEATASVGAGGLSNEVVLTANQGGLSGNDIDLWVNMNVGETLPAGMLVTVTPMATGAGTIANMNAIIAAIAGRWYTDYAMPWQDSANVALLTAELVRRSNAMVSMDGVAYLTLTGSYGTIMTNKAAMNTMFVDAMGITNSPSTPWSVTAARCAMSAWALTNDPSRQLRSLVLPGIVPPRPADQYAPYPAQQNLLVDGISTYEIQPGNIFAISRSVTTDTLNPEGVPDTTWQDIMAVKTAARIRYDWKAYRDSLYPRPKLVPDGSLAALNDPTAVTPSSMTGSWAARHRFYGRLGWVENVDANNALANFDINPSDKNRMDGNMPITTSGNLIVLATVLQVN